MERNERQRWKVLPLRGFSLTERREREKREEKGAQRGRLAVSVVSAVLAVFALHIPRDILMWNRNLWQQEGKTKMKMQ